MTLKKTIGVCKLKAFTMQQSRILCFIICVDSVNRHLKLIFRQKVLCRKATSSFFSKVFVLYENQCELCVSNIHQYDQLNKKYSLLNAT